MSIRILASALVVSLGLAQPVLAKDPPKPTETPMASPAAKPDAKSDSKSGSTPSAGQAAARQRQKTCGAQWRALAEAEQTAQGPTWPKYWSKCNKRLKGEKA